MGSPASTGAAHIECCEGQNAAVDAVGWVPCPALGACSQVLVPLCGDYSRFQPVLAGCGWLQGAGGASGSAIVGKAF